MRERPGAFHHHGHRLAYSEYGRGERTIVLVHGLLFSRRMHEPLARSLAADGFHVVTLDLLGHGDSDRPQDMRAYSMPIFGGQIVALLDHLELADAVVGGTSLGANATLEAYAAAGRERIRGMVLEMPVLDNALLGCALAFTPMLVLYTGGRPLMRLVSAGARLVPRGLPPFLLDLVLDTARQDSGPSAAVLQGLFFGRTAPPHDERVRFDAPALVIGHERDPIHPFSDADGLAAELPDARLLQASSFLEMRIAPRRITAEIGAFAGSCWPGDGVEHSLTALV